MLGVTLDAQRKLGRLSNPTEAAADAMMHKTASIASVNRRLQDPERAVQLSTLMTVTTLLSHEVRLSSEIRLQPPMVAISGLQTSDMTIQFPYVQSH